MSGRSYVFLCDDNNLCNQSFVCLKYYSGTSKTPMQLQWIWKLVLIQRKGHGTIRKYRDYKDSKIVIVSVLQDNSDIMN